MAEAFGGWLWNFAEPLGHSLRNFSRKQWLGRVRSPSYVEPPPTDLSPKLRYQQLNFFSLNGLDTLCIDKVRIWIHLTFHIVSWPSKGHPKSVTFVDSVVVAKLALFGVPWGPETDYVVYFHIDLLIGPLDRSRYHQGHWLGPLDRSRYHQGHWPSLPASDFSPLWVTWM